MSQQADRLLAAVERYPSSIREGTDSLVLLYGWRREGGDAAGFMAAVQTVVAERWVAILPGPDMRLRLTAAGFARLDAQLPEQIEADTSLPAGADSDAS